MKKSIYLITCVALMTMAACNNGRKHTDQSARGVVMTVSVEEFAKVIARDDVRLIDVRTAQEYAEGHLQGAENIDVKASNFDELTKDVDGTVAVYYRGGRRSLNAANQLAAQGCTVYDLDGGITAWKQAGKKIIK